MNVGLKVNIDCGRDGLWVPVDGDFITLVGRKRRRSRDDFHRCYADMFGKRDLEALAAK